MFDFMLADPVMQSLRHAANHRGDGFYGCPHRRVVIALLKDKSHCSFTICLCKLIRFLLHGSILSSVGASTKPGAIQPADSEFLFCNRHGQGYINPVTDEAPGWKTMWQNFMKRVLAETKVTEHFTEHDLRAKCASNAKTLDHARALLSHVDSGTTLKVYRRAPEKVQPLPDNFNGTL